MTPTLFCPTLASKGAAEKAPGGGCDQGGTVAHSALALLPLDYVEFFVFLAVLCVVGVVSGRGERENSTDYFLAGRRLPWYAVGGSYVAANVSTEHFIGLVGASYILGMPPALAQWQTTIAEVVIVFLFVPFLIRAKVTTVPEYLAQRFGPGVRLAFALLTIFANITIFMAAVMYAGGLALSGFFGWPLLWCIIGTGLFAGGWAVYGGLNTVAWTGVFTAIVKIGGVTLLTILALKGDDAIGRDHRWLHRHHPRQYGRSWPVAGCAAGLQPASHPLRHLQPADGVPAARSSADALDRHLPGLPGGGRVVRGDEPVHRPARPGRARHLACAHGPDHGRLCQAVPAADHRAAGPDPVRPPSRIHAGRLGHGQPSRRWRLCRAGAGIFSRGIARAAAGGA